MAFGIAPAILDVGAVLPLEALLALIVGQYLLKLAIAVLDTSVVYAIVTIARSREERESGDVHAT